MPAKPPLPPDIVTVGSEGFDEAVDVLCEAFYDYPVMRYLAGDAGGDYDRQLRLLVGFFSVSRHLRGDIVWALKSEGRMIAVANIVCPETESPPALEEARAALWAELGDTVRRRYEAFSDATAEFVVAEPHYHLSMIGVRPRHAGSGLGRRLLDALHELSANDPASSGVSLTTEDPRNVPLYEYFGYRVIGSARVGGFTSWSFFRPDSPVAAD